MGKAWSRAGTSVGEGAAVSAPPPPPASEERSRSRVSGRSRREGRGGDRGHVTRGFYASGWTQARCPRQQGAGVCEEDSDGLTATSGG